MSIARSLLMKSNTELPSHCNLFRCCLGGTDFRRPAQIGPIDVRAQLFAGDGAAGGAFDGRAALGRYWPDPRYPLMHRCGRYGQQSRQGRLAAQHPAGSTNGIRIHGTIIRPRLMFVNRNCLLAIRCGLLGNA